MACGQEEHPDDRGAAHATSLAAAALLAGSLMAGVIHLGLPERLSCSIRHSLEQSLAKGSPAERSRAGCAAQAANPAQGDPDAEPVAKPSASDAAGTRAAVEGLAGRFPGLLRKVWVDPGTGVVMVELAKSTSEAQLTQFTATARASGAVSVTRATKEVEALIGAPTRMATGEAARPAVGEAEPIPLTGPEEVKPGTEINSDRADCTLAFALHKNQQSLFLTAGHCLRSLDDLQFGENGHLLGMPWQTNYTTEDSATGLLNGVYFTPSSTVETYGGAVGGDIPIVGQEVAEAGSEVCLSGRITKFSCGDVAAFDISVFKPEGGMLDGLTAAFGCALPGDSGGPIFTRDGQAQGVIWGSTSEKAADGTRFCPVGPGSDTDTDTDNFIYYQPIDEILETHGATLDLAPGAP